VPAEGEESGLKRRRKTSERQKMGERFLGEIEEKKEM